MAYGFVQFQHSAFVGAVATAATPSFTLGAQHLLVAKCVVVNASLANTTCLTMTDTLGNSFTQVAASRAAISGLNGGEGSEFWYALNTTGGTDTVTATTAAGNGNFNLQVAEYSGIQLAGAFDAANAGNGSGSPATVAVTTTFADDLVIGGYEEATAGWTWTAPMADRSGLFEGAGTCPFADRSGNPAGVYTPTMTGGSGVWIASAISFKVASTAQDTSIGAFLVGI